MGRYIDEDEVVKALTNNQTYSATVIRSILDRIPTADVEPVRHGHWIFQEDNKHSCCSSCNFKRNISTQYGWDYCPNCGAKMDGKESEE